MKVSDICLSCFGVIIDQIPHQKQKRQHMGCAILWALAGRKLIGLSPCHRFCEIYRATPNRYVFFFHAIFRFVLHDLWQTIGALNYVCAFCHVTCDAGMARGRRKKNRYASNIPLIMQANASNIIWYWQWRRASSNRWRSVDRNGRYRMLDRETLNRNTIIL